MNLRRARGMTQEEVAEKVGVSREQVSRWESGKQGPPHKRILQLCDVFGIAEEEFWRGADPENLAGRNTYESGHTKVCLYCGNTDIDPGDQEQKGDTYCIQCGFPVINQCLDANCQHANRASARRCSECGSRTAWSLSAAEREEYVEALESADKPDSVLVDQ